MESSEPALFIEEGYYTKEHLQKVLDNFKTLYDMDEIEGKLKDMFDEDRIDAIGHNGGDGEHYDK